MQFISFLLIIACMVRSKGQGQMLVLVSGLTDMLLNGFLWYDALCNKDIY